MHFPAGRQILFVRGLIFYAFSTGTKACVTVQISLMWMKTCIASHGLWAIVIWKSLLSLSADPLQESRGCSIYEHTTFHIFLTDWQLAPAGLCSMIKIISYVVIAFSYGKANILHRWSNILRIFYGNKGLCHCADLIDSDENLHCFTRPLSSCNIKISVVSQCRFTAGISWLIIIWTHSFCLFFTDWQLAPAGLRSDSVTVDADWQRLNLLTDSRHTSPETQTQIWNWLRQRPPSTSVVHYLQTVHCGLPLRQRWQNSCILSSRLMTTPYAEDMLPTRFQETAQSEQHWHSDADIEGFICRKLKDINECSSRSNMPKDGRARYVLFFKITSEIKT